MTFVCIIRWSALLLLITTSPSTPLIAGHAEDWARMKHITPRGYVCYQAKSPVQIDGKLDDASWKDAPWTEDFVDIEGSIRPKPLYRT